jgi:hypothetical protein
VARWGRGRPIRTRWVRGAPAIAAEPIAYTAASETDAATTISARKIGTFTSATETDVAEDITRFVTSDPYVAGVVRARRGWSDARFHTNRQRPKRRVRRIIHFELESQAVGPIVFTQATETDGAGVITRQGILEIGAATELDVAGCFTRVRIFAASTETDGAGTFRRNPLPFGAATETDVASTINIAGGAINYGSATETDVASAISGRKIRSFTAATEADASTAISAQEIRPFTAAVETDASTLISVRKVGTLGPATELDTARTLLVFGSDFGVPVADPQAVLVDLPGEAVLTSVSGDAILTGVDG